MKKYSYLIFALLISNHVIGQFNTDFQGTINATGYYLNGALFSPTSLWVPSSGNLYFSTGTVGIGTTTPNVAYKLDVNGIINATNLYIGGAPYLSSQWATSGTSISYMAGNIGIGTTTPDSKLTVKGTIHTNEVKVDLNGAVAPDYVFESNYELRSLKELRVYLEKYKHLPEIPSAKDMEINGINLSEMNLLLLKKIEELTLYLLEIKQESEALKLRIESIESKK